MSDLKYGYNGYKSDYKTVSGGEERIGTGRMIILLALLTTVLVLYFGVLYNTQIIHHEEYLSQSVRSIVRTETVKASRGIVTDRNGVTLISNGFAYDLTFDPSLLRAGDDTNEAILRLLQLCVEQGRTWTDTLPLSWEEPCTFTVDSISTEQKRRLWNYMLTLKECRDTFGAYLLENLWLVDASDLLAEAEEAQRESSEPSLQDRLMGFLRRDDTKSVQQEGPVIDPAKLLERFHPAALNSEILFDAGITGERFLSWMAQSFELPSSFTRSQQRSVLGVQYELRQRRLGDNTVYVLTQDVDTPFISLLSDGNYAGAKIINSSVRQYETGTAAHILGTVSPLWREDLENPLYEGYPLDATVGRNGVEAAFETYLHGKDGRRVMSVTEEGKVTGEYYSREPEPGSTVELTIDLEFQQAVENALAHTVEGITAADGDNTRGAGVAVVRVGTGEVLALASYPTFDITEFNSNYTELEKTPGNPLLNRATSGTYQPGSTLKPATAIAALDSGAITLTGRIRDTGKWNYPRTNLEINCWYKPGHGSQVISQAITNSCNYFFAELGYRMGMDTLDHYYEQFGLGEHTGIETGDAAGNRPYNPPGEDQAPWAAFGQSNQLYTPLQMSNYVATLVSGGKHCQAHLLKAVKSYDSAALIAQGNTSPLNTIDIAPEYLNAVKTGMHNLAHGSLAQFFDECVVDAGAKTGTAQTGKGITDNGAFICFAPYEEPEIAIGMVIERAGAGRALASCAVEILNAYFDRDTAASVTGENELLP